MPENGQPNVPPINLGAPDLDLDPVTSDEVFNSENLARFDLLNMQTLMARDKIYSEILTSYYKYSSSVLSKNISRQGTFFWVSLVILCVSPLQFIFFLLISRNNPNAVIIITSFAEVVASLMVFPKIIAEYLFNTNETTSINSIVTAIQNYDIAIRSGIRHTVENHKSKEQNTK